MTDSWPMILCEGTALVAAIGVLISRNLFHSVLFFLTAMLAIAGIYMLTGATYLALVQIAMYGGGVAVLMLFTVMLSGKKTDQGNFRWGGFVPPVALLIFLLVQPTPDPWQHGAGDDTAETAGLWFTGKYLLPFGISAFLLIIALVGAVVSVIQKPNQVND